MTPAVLIAGGIGPTQAALFASYLTQAFDEFQISSPLRQAAFLAQCAHESTLFVHLEEELYYRDAERAATKIFRGTFDANRDKVISPAEIEAAKPYMRNPQGLANKVYAGRNGNGNEASGDGYRYRGRGLIQLTGRNNYSAAALKLAEPYIDQPDLVAGPADACLTAGWYWDRNGLNRLADAGEVDAITRAVNGAAMEGADNRKKLYRTFLSVLTAPAASAP